MERVLRVTAGRKSGAPNQNAAERRVEDAEFTPVERPTRAQKQAARIALEDAKREAARVPAGGRYGVPSKDRHPA